MNHDKDKIRKTTEDLINACLSDYRFDYYIPNYKNIEGINWSRMESFIANTIQSYQKHHPDSLFTITKKSIIYELFNHKEINRKVVLFKEVQILPELYKILWLIDVTQQRKIFLNDTSIYPGNYFAKIQSDLKEVKKLRMHHKKNIIGVTRLADPTEARLRYWLATLYYQNKTLTKFFLHILLIADLEKVTLLENEKTKETMMNALEFFMVQRTTHSALIKSLGILLYFEIKLFLNLSHNDAAIYTQNILYEFFNSNVNMEEFKRSIFIKSSIGPWPIFGAGKKSPMRESEKAFIRQTLFEELGRYIRIDEKQFDAMFDSFMRRPHIQFLHKYPRELFRKNPKYSS